jgi:hypothetical protein
MVRSTSTQRCGSLRVRRDFLVLVSPPARTERQRGKSGQGDPPWAARVHPGSRRYGAAASPRPSDASPTARRLPRTAAPVTGRLRSPPYPAAAPASTTARPMTSRRVRRSPENATATGPERRALSGLAPPASTVLRIPLRGTRLRRAVDPGDLCQPSGPDGEGQARGQARSARGKTLVLRRTAKMLALP